MSSKQTKEKDENPYNGREYAVNTQNTNLWYDSIETQLQRDANVENSKFLTERELAHDAYRFDKGSIDYWLKQEDYC